MRRFRCLFFAYNRFLKLFIEIRSVVEICSGYCNLLCINWHGVRGAHELFIDGAIVLFVL